MLLVSPEKVGPAGMLLESETVEDQTLLELDSPERVGPTGTLMDTLGML